MGTGLSSTRFPSKPQIMRVPFSLLFSFNKETPNKKGKRALLGYLVKKAWDHGGGDLGLRGLGFRDVGI